MHRSRVVWRDDGSTLVLLRAAARGLPALGARVRHRCAFVRVTLRVVDVR